MYEFDARRVVAQSRLARVEGVVDVTRHRLCVRAHALLRGIVRHVFVNVAGQLFDGPIPAERVIVFALRPLAVAPMTFGAELAEDFATLLVLFRAAHALLARQKTQQRQPGEALN